MCTKKQTVIKKTFLVHTVKDVKPICKKFRPIIRRIKRNCQITCTKKIKGYEIMPEDVLISALTSSKPVKKTEKPNTRAERIREEVKKFRT